jgi:hypothetical protein
MGLLGHRWELTHVRSHCGVVVGDRRAKPGALLARLFKQHDD